MYAPQVCDRNVASEKRQTLRSMFGVLVAASLAAVTFGCDEDVSFDEDIDTGNVCIRQSAEGALEVGVASETCYSGSCSEKLVSQCSLTRDGTDLKLTSYTRVKVWGGTCTADCVSYSAGCELANVPPGTYTLRHGEFTGTITLPLTSTWASDPNSFPPCF